MADTTRDPGLQPERTRLAWRRTALAVTGVALLAARLAIVTAAPLGLLAVVGLWLAVLVVSQRRVAAMASAGGDCAARGAGAVRPAGTARPAAAGRSLPALALIVAGYAVLGGLLVLW